MDYVMLQVLQILVVTLLVVVVAHDAIQNQDDVVSFAKEPVLVDDTRLVLQEGENGELVIQEHPPLIVLVAMVTSLAGSSGTTEG